MQVISVLSYPFQLLILVLIRSYKWAELQLLRLTTPILQKFFVELFRKLGIVPHFSEDGDIYSHSAWTPQQEAKALAKCAPKYNSLIHLQITNKREFLAKCVNTYSRGLAETYMAEQWYCPESDDDITQFVKRFLESGLFTKLLHPWNRLLNYTELCVLNLQTRSKSSEVVDKHYDLGNDLYESFLDPNMQYTCGYWANSDNLNDAQFDKLELIAKKLDLKPGMRVLDIGCGWGMLCKHLSERYEVECVGVTISEIQAEYARKQCEGLKVEIRMQDYRDVNEKFDRMTVVGMLEHVGFHNYDEFFRIAHQNLKDDGIFLVHTIGLNHEDIPRSDPFYHKYIFPNSNLPFPSDITSAIKGRFIIEDWHNFGPDYVKTLRAWKHNFRTNWPKIEDRYGDQFYRMWTFYLSFSAGIFEPRRSHLWQIVLSKNGLQTGYRAAR